jgi:catechol-2,3-dioxygenase
MSMQTTALLVITVTLLAFAAQSQATAQSSQLVFFELTVRDLARAKSFYGHVLGGTFSDSPSPDFVSINGAGVPVEY